MFAGLFARLGLWLAAFALLSQSLALAAPPMFPDDPRSAATELSALLGPGVVVCAQSDGQDIPSHPPSDCRDQCPLCQVVANAAALDSPATAELSAPARARATRLGHAPLITGIPAPRVAFSFARGPPSPT